MNPLYTVKAGDTLGKIAQLHGTTAVAIQALNPLISDPHQIEPGWQLKLPSATAKLQLPPPMHAHNTSSTLLKGQAPCSEELVDVLHITGEEGLYVLTDRQSQDLKQEIRNTQALMDELHQGLHSAQPSSQCLKPGDPQAQCPCAACIKEQWASKAEAAGLLMRAPVEAPAPAHISAEQDLPGQIETVKQAIDWYENYRPDLTSASRQESNWKPLRARKLTELQAQLEGLQARLPVSPHASKDSATLANSAKPDPRYGLSISTADSGGRQTQDGIQVIEVAVFSQPDRRYYIARRYRERVEWRVQVRSKVLQSHPFDKALAGKLIQDIRDNISANRKTGPLGGLQGKLAEWKSQDDNLLNALHREAQWTSNASDAAPYAVSAEAHLMRFAASASAGITSWNPKAGNIEVGGTFDAAFSLAEGAASFSAFLPEQGGLVLKVPYRNALGDPVDQPLGALRLEGKMALSCFAGAKANAEAGVKAQHRPEELPAGGSALLGRPSVEVGRSGAVGVKAGGMAGVQAGGALSGALQWLTVEDQDKLQPGATRTSGNWSDIALIQAEGNVAFGAGLSGEFGITITKDRLTFNCAGSLVFGPGAGGGFGTEVNLEKTAELVLLLGNALYRADYRYLLNVEEQAFEYIARGLYQVATAPAQAVIGGFELGRDQMILWWEGRQASKAEAASLAQHLLLHLAVLVQGRRIPLNRLPPQTIGMMLHVLSRGYADSWEENQEKAMVLLLSHLRSWRYFIEVLEHCSADGSKVKALDSLERLNALLDGYQQSEFNRFTGQLAVLQGPAPSHGQLAWKPTPSMYKKEVLLAARRSRRFDGLA